MNEYTPPLTRTVYPKSDHRRFQPNYTQIKDVDREKFFTNWNERLVKKMRIIKIG